MDILEYDQSMRRCDGRVQTRSAVALAYQGG